MSWVAATVGAFLGYAIASPGFWLAVLAVLAFVWWRKRGRA